QCHRFLLYEGGVVGALLDMEIMKSTNGSKSLDDVMKEMYQLYYKKLNRPFTEPEFITVVNKVAGKDLSEFFKKYVHDTIPLPLEKSLAVMGLEIIDLNSAQSMAWTGATTTSTNGKMMVTAVERNSPAWKYGINVNDEILAMDKFRVGDDLSKLLSLKRPGETVTFTVSRNGSLKEIQLVLEKSSSTKYAIEKSPSQQEAEKMMYKKWLKM
ncbi:MAG: PDZ domain-containing protein, partial [Bacteroidetes bacterium]|nr:PDZ domain-containing protein [Bacteroidota bacterium]